MRGLSTASLRPEELSVTWMWQLGAWQGRTRAWWRGLHVIDTGDIDVFLGLDVGKDEHHATAVTPAGKKTFDKRLPNPEPKLRELFAKLQAKHGTVLVVVDQPASIGALPLAVARDMGCPVAYLPGLCLNEGCSTACPPWPSHSSAWEILNSCNKDSHPMSRN